jgi:hypothetical protein
MTVIATSKFEGLFRFAANLDVDKEDLRRHADPATFKPPDLLMCGETAAKASGRNVVEPFNLPITKGLQDRIHAFKATDEEMALAPILNPLARQRPLDLPCGA